MNAEKMLLKDAIKTAIRSEKRLTMYKRLIMALIALNITLIFLCIAIML